MMCFSKINKYKKQKIKNVSLLLFLYFRVNSFHAMRH